MPPAANSTIDARTNGTAYFFSLALSAGTVNRQTCHNRTGSAAMIPPYIPTRMRVAMPSVGLNVLSVGSQKSAGLRAHSSTYGWIRKSSTWL